MAKTIMSIVFEFPGGVLDSEAFSSDRSLLDADIVIFEPIFPWTWSENQYNGRPLLNDTDSFRLREAVDHWRDELQMALEQGKTVFLILKAPYDVFIHTGEKQYSGTGRSRVTTNMVEPIDNYRLLPVRLGTIKKGSGEIIGPIGNLGVLSSYWKDFQDFSYYEAYIDGHPRGSLLVTKTGKKTVGGVFQVRNGSLVVLPPISFEGTEYLDDDKWTAKAQEVGLRLQQHIVAIDHSLRSGMLRTPPPGWTKENVYELSTAKAIEGEIDQIGLQISELDKVLVTKRRELDNANSAKRLLYEQGRSLEDAILDCLNLMGFSAGRVEDGESEFDAVFESEEGRFLGEVEGKDNAAVNIGKLSQLERNIQEDFQRDGVDDYAKGVLFGNAYRFTAPTDRGEFFTSKCLTGALRARVALVRTPDLFPVLKYLQSCPDDEEYKRGCRIAMLQAEGDIVDFPSPPKVQ